MVVELAATKCLLLHSYLGFCSVSSQHFYSAAEHVCFFIEALQFPVHSSWFLFAYLSSDKGFFYFFISAIADYLSCAHMPCLLHASTYTCTHVPTPCSVPSQSLFLPLHAPYPSILSSLKSPHWPSPSNRMIIWHNVTPPDAWWGLQVSFIPPFTLVAGVWGWKERKMERGGWIYLRKRKGNFTLTSLHDWCPPAKPVICPQRVVLLSL